MERESELEDWLHISPLPVLTWPSVWNYVELLIETVILPWSQTCTQNLMYQRCSMPLHCICCWCRWCEVGVVEGWSVQHVGDGDGAVRANCWWSGDADELNGWSYCPATHWRWETIVLSSFVAALNGWSYCPATHWRWETIVLSSFVAAAHLTNRFVGHFLVSAMQRCA